MTALYGRVIPVRIRWSGRVAIIGHRADEGDGSLHKFTALPACLATEVSLMDSSFIFDVPSLLARHRGQTIYFGDAWCWPWTD
jgi:hypothetical protein